MPSGGGDQLVGQLAVDGPCLYVVDQASTRWIPIWPADGGYRVAGGVLTGSTGTRPIGGAVVLTGNGYQTDKALQPYLITPVDPACLQGNYWLITGVTLGSATVGPSQTPIPTAPVATTYRTWARIDLPRPTASVMNETMVGVVRFRGQYVALGGLWAACCTGGDPSLNSGVIWTSTDGRRWRLREGIPALAHASPAGLVTDGSHLVAFGSYAAPITGLFGVPVPALWVSDDGTTWTRVPGPVPSAVAVGPSGFVGAISAQGPDGTGTVSFATSADGLNWLPTSTTYAGFVQALAVSPAGTALGIGSVPGLPSSDGSRSSVPVSWWSEDLHTWASSPSLAGDAQPVAVVGVGDGFALAMTRTTVLSTGGPDLTSELWRFAADASQDGGPLSLGDRTFITRLLAAGDVVVATGTITDATGVDNGLVWVSVDGGRTFGRLPPQAGLQDNAVVIEGVVSAGEGLLAVGEAGSLGGPTGLAAWLAAR